MYPITGIAGCCARAAIGHAAAPPSNVMNSRRTIQAGDETSLDWIASSSENDRDRPGRSLGLHYRSRGLWCDNHRHVPTNQIGRQFRQPLIVIVRPAEFDRDIAAFDESGFAQTSEER